MAGAATRPARGDGHARLVAAHRSALPRRVSRLLRSARRHAAAAASWGYGRWHRSLQLRVISTTLVISVGVAAVIGFFLIQQITSGLLLSERKLALTQTSNGLTSAQAALQTGRAPGQPATLLHLAKTLQDASGPGVVYDVVIRSVSSTGVGGVVGNQAWDPSVPRALSAEVAAEQRRGLRDRLWYAPTQLVSSKTGKAGPPALAVGAPLTGNLQLYYLFPLTPQVQTIRLVRATVIVAGAALVVLLAVIVSLVTRWVVVPIRQAAQAARRLSDGDLNERMPMRGTDDLAGLARSFNEMAASLQEQLHQLEELSQGQRQFVSDVSHELRTPLTTIRIAADVLFEAKEQFDPAAGRSAELLQGQLERFEALLADLLEISRYDANAVTLDAESADVCDLVRRAAADAEQLAARTGTRIEFRLPPRPCVAEVDRRRIERVLRNLLDNAVEHGEGHDVVVTVAGDRDAVAVAVRDHGVGIGPEEQQLVFDRFWRSDPARARSTGGTGLGLAIALEDTRLHGGWLQAWGERGRGSVFRLTLPRSAGQELVGSPLPLGPDEAEIAIEGAVAGAFPAMHVSLAEGPPAGPVVDGAAVDGPLGAGPVGGAGAARPEPGERRSAPAGSGRVTGARASVAPVTGAWVRKPGRGDGGGG